MGGSLMLYASEYRTALGCRFFFCGYVVTLGVPTPVEKIPRIWPLDLAHQKAVAPPRHPRYLIVYDEQRLLIVHTRDRLSTVTETAVTVTAITLASRHAGFLLVRVHLVRVAATIAVIMPRQQHQRSSHSGRPAGQGLRPGPRASCHGASREDSPKHSCTCSACTPPSARRHPTIHRIHN